MTFRERCHDVAEGLKRYHYPLGMIIFAIAIGVALWQLQDVQRENALQSELRGYELCLNQQDTRSVLREVLEALVGPRETDEPGDLEQREELLEGVLPLIEQPDCPPQPTRDDIP